MKYNLMHLLSLREARPAGTDLPSVESLALYDTPESGVAGLINRLKNRHWDGAGTGLEVMLTWTGRGELNAFVPGTGDSYVVTTQVEDSDYYQTPVPPCGAIGPREASSPCVLSKDHAQLDHEDSTGGEWPIDQRPEKVYLQHDPCGEVFDDLTVAHFHSCEDGEPGDSWSVVLESEAF